MIELLDAVDGDWFRFYSNKIDIKLIIVIRVSNKIDIKQI
jgi:hypothetical protein